MFSDILALEIVAGIYQQVRKMLVIHLHAIFHRHKQRNLKVMHNKKKNMAKKKLNEGNV